jgi:voltage-gated potassium channel
MGRPAKKRPSENDPLLAKGAQQPSVLQEEERMTRLSYSRLAPVLAVILDKKHHRRNSNVQASSPAMSIEVAASQASEHHPKSFVYTMLNPRSNAMQAIVFKWFISIVIVADLVAFVISTEPDLDQHHKQFFYVWEGATSSVFLLEYIARLVVVTEAEKYHDQGPIWGRISYAKTTPALIDLLATIPFFAELLTAFSLPTLTYLRAFRLLRILKTSGFADATNSVYRVIYYNRQILYVAFLICVFLVLFTALLMYYLRPKDSQSPQFQSLGATMYLSTLLLTGQGGPDGELPWYTKGVVLMTGVFSIGMFAIPASMLTWGFEAEAERMATLAYARRTKQPSRVDEPERDNWSFSSGDYSTDEEYRKIIAGDGDDEDAVAREAFRLADIDGSGKISLSEYLALSRQQVATAKVGPALSSQDIGLCLSTMERRIEENSQKLDRITALLVDLKNSK